MSKRFLSELIDGLRVQSAAGDHSATEITSLTDDSRQVEPGSLFVAVRGVDRDGAEYIPAALEQGAAAVLSREGVSVPPGVAHVTAANERKMLAKLAARFYSPQPRHMVAVTGTDGKTSTVEFFRQLIEATESKAASLGTLGLSSNTVRLKVPALNTSPNPVLLHQTLQKLAQAECQYVALEASSHGLDQFRLDGVKLTAGAFTNLTRDHMDYHKSLEDYFNAKMRLFRQVLPRSATAVVWKQEKRLKEIEKTCALRKHRLVTFGENADLNISQLERKPTGMVARLNLHGNRVEVELGLIGDFQLLNILAAMGLAEACGKDILTLQHLLHQIRPVRGRLEKAAQLENGAAAYVDYAHTATALQKALQVLRGHCAGKLVVVFGCGGDRDKGKRPLMGKAASELADRVFITDDNPRTEDAAMIRQQVQAGCAEGAAVTVIGDRKQAIAAALNELQAGDILLVAGKGHEDYQIIGTEKQPFDDVKVIRELAG